MINNLPNNIILNLTTNQEINDENLYKVDFKTIIANAKNDKMFNKLLTLCIKHDIYLFNQYNNLCSILNIDNLLLQSNEKQKYFAGELSKKILEISVNNSNNEWLIEIENIYIQYRKKFKDIEVIIYILKNIFSDSILQSLCCVQINSTKQIIKKKDIKKYIAIYSN
jgi:hypothetical protein